MGTDLPCTHSGKTINGNGVPYVYRKPASGTFGSARNNTERNPDFKNVDLSLFKAFRAVGDQFLEFGVDACNAFNIASYAAPHAQGAASMAKSRAQPITQGSYSCR